MPTRCGEYFVDVPHTSAYLNCAASNQTIVKVGRCARFLRVHADQLQVFPQHLQQVVQVEVHIAAHHHRERLAGQPVHLLDRDLVDLVVHVDARQIDPVAGDHVDELVLRAVLPEQDLRVENLERVQYRLYHLFVAPGQRAGRVKADPAPLLDLEVDVGPALVQPQPDRLQLVLEQIPVHVRFGRVQHHQHQIGGARDRYHLPAATLALGRPLDDAGQIEQLVDSSVDLPTDGKPIRAMRASPDLSTSNPSPFSPFFDGSSSCDRYFASFAFSNPRWYSVAVLSGTPR
uniref:Uncharacterized protein n=1 Tax=Anopheles melas TaxID=34690 RepID=A0A182U889_9DIPT